MFCFSVQPLNSTPTDTCNAGSHLPVLELTPQELQALNDGHVDTCVRVSMLLKQIIILSKSM